MVIFGQTGSSPIWGKSDLRELRELRHRRVGHSMIKANLVQLITALMLDPRHQCAPDCICPKLREIEEIAQELAWQHSQPPRTGDPALRTTKRAALVLKRMTQR